MCGIVGYIGNKFVDSVLVVGLQRLEYRGYDSAGIATICEEGDLLMCKKKGKLKILDDCLKQTPLGGNIGIGHTRWATHGEPSEINAHPHIDCKKEIAVVHNGIIENYLELKEELISESHIFASETDTEVIVHLIEKFVSEEKSLENAVLETLKLLKGSYAICVISIKEPDRIIVAKVGSPLIIGVGKDENFIASDIPAIMQHTRSVIYLNDYEMATLTKKDIGFFNLSGQKITKEIEQIGIEIQHTDKADFQYFMLKEIYEQPQIIEKIISTRLKQNQIIFEEINLDKKYFSKVKRIIIQACGTSWHAGLVAKYWFEKYAHIHTEVDVSSEFRYRNPVVEGDTLMLAISQSGETADTLAGIREAKSKFIKVVSVVNVIRSSISRESDGIIPILAGPEIGVASTKAYTAQLVSLYIFVIYLSLLNYTITEQDSIKMLDELKKIPFLMRKFLTSQDELNNCVEKYYSSKDFIFLGRGISYPNALEGALKLKEISYIHSTGYPAGEFKHGPIALIHDKMPVVCLSPKGELYPKILSNIEEVIARKGIIIAIASENDDSIKNIVKHVIYVPNSAEDISPVLTVLPLQLLAYYIAVKLSCDVDKPRNLAKSVTVE